MLPHKFTGSRSSQQGFDHPVSSIWAKRCLGFTGLSLSVAPWSEQGENSTRAICCSRRAWGEGASRAGMRAGMC